MISFKNFTNFDASYFLTIVEIVMKYKLAQFVRKQQLSREEDTYD